MVRVVRIRLCTYSQQVQGDGCRHDYVVRTIDRSGFVDPLLFEILHEIHEDVMLSRYGLLFPVRHAELWSFVKNFRRC